MTRLSEYPIELGGTWSRALELEGSGPPILLLHGFADSAETWRPVLERLGSRGRHALAIDLPGFGNAANADPGRRLLPQLDRAVTAALRRFPQGSTPVVAGNSMGGTAALRAAQNPDLGIGAVVPLAPAGLSYPRWFSMIERSPQVQTLLSLPLPLPAGVSRFLIGQAYRNLAFSTPADANPDAVEWFARNVGGRKELARKLGLARRALPELDDAYELSRISCDVLVIWGSRDRLVPAAGARRILEQLPGARIEILAGGGHCPQVEMPDTTARLIEEAASRLE